MRLVALALLAGCSFRSPSGGEAPDAEGPGRDGRPADATVTIDAPIAFVIQAEAATRRTTPPNIVWESSMIPADHMGTGSMTLRPSSLMCMTPLSGLCASLELDVMITEQRTYHLFARMYASNGSEDSLFYALDDVSSMALDTDEIAPAWRWEGNLSRDLAPGLHTIKIWNRNSNLHLDAVALMPSDMPPP